MMMNVSPIIVYLILVHLVLQINLNEIIENINKKLINQLEFNYA